MRNRIILLLIISCLMIIISCSKKEEPIKEPPKSNPFNLAIDGLIEVRDTIQQNHTLSEILIPHSVSQATINDIEKKSLQVFHTQKFRADNELYIYAKWDSVETVKYLVYVQDAVNYVVYDLRDSIKIYKKQKPFVIKQVAAGGSITNSLYQTLEEKNIDPNIAVKLADIYECQIDFFHIQQNDSFKVFYEQTYVENKPVASGKILAACFSHAGNNFYAFSFDKEGGKYFDEKGNSLQRLFLKAPLKFSRITSKYSLNRYHPVLHRTKAHLGTDYAALTGTPIMTVGNGVVIEAGYRGGNGNYVKVKHNATYTTQYLHMSRIANGIRRGVHVTQGQLIGYVGSTGLATGPHVCFRFWKNGRQVNPLKEKYQSSGPVSKKYKMEFSVLKDSLMKKLIAPLNITDDKSSLINKNSENKIKESES